MSETPPFEVSGVLSAGEDLGQACGYSEASRRSAHQKGLCDGWAGHASSPGYDRRRPEGAAAEELRILLDLDASGRPAEPETSRSGDSHDQALSFDAAEPSLGGKGEDQRDRRKQGEDRLRSAGEKAGDCTPRHLEGELEEVWKIS